VGVASFSSPVPPDHLDAATAEVARDDGDRIRKPDWAISTPRHGRSRTTLAEKAYGRTVKTVRISPLAPL
jgi:hypothetical protein